MSDSDDDVPTLSAHTLAALQEFYNETKADAGSSPSDHFSVGALEEDWVGESWFLLRSDQMHSLILAKVYMFYIVRN